MEKNHPQKTLSEPKTRKIDLESFKKVLLLLIDASGSLICSVTYSGEEEQNGSFTNHGDRII